MLRTAPAPLSLALRTGAAGAAIALLTGALTVSCSGDPIGTPGSPDNRPDSAAMGQWDQRFDGACSKARHDSWYVIGPDGKRYPTWHPPTDIDPDTGRACSYGHEHGENPAGAALWNDLRRHFAWDANGNGSIDDSERDSERSGVPFGYLSEQYNATAGAGAHSHEHRSYRIHFANGVLRQRLVNGQPQAFDLQCDHFAAFSMDTASASALANNLHALTWAVDCNRGAAAATYAPKFIVSALAAYGSVEQIVGEDGGAVINTQGSAPRVPNVTVAPTTPRGAEAAPRRLLPVRARVFDSAFVAFGQQSDLPAALREQWDAVVAVTTSGGAELARFNPGLATRDPARWYDDARAVTVRSIGLCYSGLTSGGLLIDDPAQSASIVRQVRGSTDCALLDPTGLTTPVARRVAFDAPAARFKGCARQLIVRDQSVANAGGPSIWFTDAFGRNARTTSFTGGVRQFIAPVNAGSSIVLADALLDETVDCSTATGVRVPSN